MNLAMEKGFDELNNSELLEVEGGFELLGAAIATLMLIIAVESGIDNGKVAGRRKFEAEIEEEKYKYPTPVPTPTPTLSVSYN